MSIIHLNQIKSYLKKNFTNLIDLSDYDNKSETDRENVFLSRSLAAFSLVILNNLSYEDAGKSITDGNKDNGIDAIYFDKKTRTLFVIQSKWNNKGNKTIDQAGILKFINGFKKLINNEYSGFNNKFKTKISDIETALEDSQTKFSLVIIYSGLDNLATEPQNDLHRLLEEMNDPSDIVDLTILKQLDIHNAVSQGLNCPINEDVMLYDWGQVKEPYHSFYGQVSAQDISKWYSSYRNRLFSSNIRVFLGNKNVNEGIIETLKNNPESFWYYNNGITALCSSIQKKPLGGNSRNTGIFECKDLKIVNGAQTVGSISSAYQNYPEKLEEAKVSIRLISLENCSEEFATNVTRYNNTQNQIDSRDFVALDPEQERIKNELKLEDINYVYKSGEVVADLNKGFDLVEATISLACKDTDVTTTVRAKDKIGTLWEDIEKTPYKNLFNSSISGLNIWRLVQIMRIVEQKLSYLKKCSTGRKKLFATHANKLILHLVYKQLDQNIFNPLEQLNKENINHIEYISENFLEQIVNQANNLYPDSYPANICRTLNKCKEIIGQLNSII
ncbi:AIPR family protein [Cyanobacterium aponinum]|uniref:AIPR family protein n=1 Tax=Cyanobacterium aponinum TaxID=379064 RepID=UPI000C12BE31|nr:AIPR family protein [Cyanobacterium aponinum]PHV63899.1 abortive phage infection protein [Cyanobacterium aponinum IPPAS B-1201]